MMLGVLTFLSGTAFSADDPRKIRQVSEGLQVGSYGRVAVGTDARGAGGTPATVAIPTRLVKAPYLELDLAWREVDEESGARFDAVVTPALTGALFHYDGAFDGDLTLRNLYAAARDAVAPGVEVWAGSRMVRGDDIYLLDFWPLDNLNVVGGGAVWASEASRVALSTGLNRLDAGAWQVQTVDVAAPGGVGTEAVTVLDRQRSVAALTGDHQVHLGDTLVLRPRVHGEVHLLPEGTRKVEDGTVSQALPADHGVLVGAELSLWGWSPESHANVFVRHATGLAAVGLLTVPTDGFAADRTVTDAREDMLGVAANQEFDRGSIAVGLALRSWRDADGQDVDADDVQDASLAVRPALKVGAHGNLGLELAHERSWRHGPDPRSGAQELATITRLSLLPAVQLRQGTFGRPQVRLQYTASLLDDAARARFHDDDIRSQQALQHWVGLGAEWWINSWSYR